MKEITIKGALVKHKKTEILPFTARVPHPSTIAREVIRDVSKVLFKRPRNRRKSRR